MKQIKKIYVIACQHGNELFGLKVLAPLAERSNPNIRLRVGNLEAISKDIRYVESDLNRSFGKIGSSTKEGRLAKGIVKEIKEFDPDVIIDLHTSVVDVGKVSILAEDSPFLQAISSKLGMERIAVMLPDITREALLGQFPTKSVSLEFGVHHTSDKLAHEIADLIYSLLGTPIEPHENELELYKVERIVKKNEIVNVAFANFIFNDKLGGFPFLMGESNYSDYAGFLAKKIR
jgi:succinylglutamate desuccinylase